MNARDRVAHWDDERALGNSLIVTLKDGWQFGTDPAQAIHVEGFDTKREAKQAVAAAVPCDCETCRKAKS